MYFIILNMNKDQVRCAHILIKHIGSRNPLDRLRNKKITRSLEEARNILSQIKEKIGNDLSLFSKYAKEYSECSSSQNGGDLGYFGRGDMQEAFEKVSFSLAKDQISDLVETDSGVHIILRID